MRPLTLQRGRPRQNEDRGAGRPALAETVDREPRMAEARQPGGGCRTAEGGSADRPAEKGDSNTLKLSNVYKTSIICLSFLTLQLTVPPVGPALAGEGLDPTVFPIELTIKLLESDGARARRDGRLTYNLGVSHDLGEIQVTLNRMEDLIELLRRRGTQTDLVRKIPPLYPLLGDDLLTTLGSVLNDEKEEVDARVRALYILEKIGPEAAPHLTRAMAVKPASLRSTVVSALGHVGKSNPSNESILKNISRALEDTEMDVRRAAVIALKRVAVASHVGHTDEKIPEHVALSLPEKLVDFSREHEDHRSIPSLTIDVLGYLGPAAAPAVPDLIKWLEEHPNKKQNIAKALGLIGPEAAAAAPALAAMLKNDQRWWNRSAAAKALGAIGPATDEVRKALEAAVSSDPDERVRKTATTTLATLDSFSSNSSDGIKDR